MYSPGIQGHKVLTKRESLLKTVLLENAKNKVSGIYKNKFFFEEFMSDFEDDYLF
jgi:hypothetical protein